MIYFFGMKGNIQLDVEKQDKCCQMFLHNFKTYLFPPIFGWTNKQKWYILT